MPVSQDRPEEPELDLEELDPEPTPRARHFHVRETILGIILLFGVLAWAGWEGWRQETQRANYYLAQEAAARHDWEEARDLYIAASGYRDAAAQAAEAGRRIAERDRQYEAALEHLKRQEWATALQAMQEVRRIDPGYRDVEALATETNERVYREALQGAIVSRTRDVEGKQAGLYYRTADEWVWLVGSDKGSRVLNRGFSDQIAYDVPMEGAGPEPGRIDSGITDNPGPRSDRLEGRGLMLASVSGDKITYRRLSLDPADYDNYSAGRRGVWAPRVSWAMMELDSGGDRLLLANWEEPQEGPDTIAHLYLADAMGGNRRLLYSHVGGFYSAQFGTDPEGRYILLTTYRFERYAVVLLDAVIESPSPPRLLAEGAPAGPSSPPGTNPPAGATFLSGGPFTGKVLLAHWDEGKGVNSISVLDPADPGNVLLKAKVEGPGRLQWVVEQEEWAGTAGTSGTDSGPSDAGLVLAGQAYEGAPIRSGGPVTNTLTLARIARGEQPKVSRLVVSSSNDERSPPIFLRGVRAARIMGDRLVYVVAPSAWQSGEMLKYSVHSLPLASLGDDQAKAIEIYSVTLPEIDSFFADASRYLGPKMLVYIDKDSGELHARTWDGKVDVILEGGLEGGMASFYNLHWPWGLNWLR